ncbi:uncharacterized protein si:ch211-106h4.12 isoform X3 [Chanodichthys erythropterus]|uniref:uncharacterized protein si:ch211-106h4.12 isoform X3 n=1 Tax=Chanodichthys erythropterus TaxID=933992 RepID=UPI00351F37B8
MCEYKAEMKCTWTAESSRMKGSVQLGLLCLSLLISSLHGEVETDQSSELPLTFEEPDLHQPEMYRVRRQTVSTEKEDTAKTEVVVTSRVKLYRTKRQSKSKGKKKGTHRPGRYSLLAMGSPKIPKQLVRAKRDTGHWPGR